MMTLKSDYLIQQNVKQSRCQHKKNYKIYYKKTKQTEGMAVEPTTYDR